MKDIISVSKKLAIAIMFAAALLILALTVITAVSAGRRLDQNVSRRAAAELNTAAAEQSALIRKELGGNFEPLEYVAEYLKAGAGFGSEESSEVLQAVSASNHWKIIGYADRDGEAADFLGNALGNIGNRSYFQNIMGGSSGAIAFMPDTNLGDGPKFVFAIPFRPEDGASGVLFASMEPSELERITLGNAEKDDITELLFLDSIGTIFGANADGEEHSGGHNFYESHNSVPSEGGIGSLELKRSMQAHESGSSVYEHADGSEILVYRWTGVNDWYVIAMADLAEAEAKYAPNLKDIRRLISSVTVLCVAMLVVMVASTVLVLRRMSNAMDFEERKNSLLLVESGGEQFVYDVRKKVLSGHGPFFRQHFPAGAAELPGILARMQSSFPESSDVLSEIIGKIRDASTTGKTEVFERPTSFRGTPHWFRTVIVPFAEDGGNVSHVFASISDMTSLHGEFERNAEMLSNVPGGLYRCRLDAPAHLEYIGDGLCRLFGYTKNELTELFGGQELLLVHEEDRAPFRAMLRRLAEEEGTGTCEYRMTCKDGHVITVSDTMESLRAADGSMYGYSVVTDVTEKAAELEAVKERVRTAEAHEAFLLDEQRTLASAVRSAYSMIISANLTRNSYYMIEYDNFSTRKAARSGSFDELIEVGAGTIPDEEQAQQFRELLNREALIRAYREGKKSVSLRHRQVGDDGVIHWNDTRVVFVPENENGDVREITLVCSADENQGMLENLRETLQRLSIYREIILTRSTGYMEINFTSGYIEGDVLDLSGNGGAETVRLPELGSPMKYEDYKDWWAEHMIVSEPEAYKRLASVDSVLSRFRSGCRFFELVNKSRYFDGKEHDFVTLYFLFGEKPSEDVRGICILIDITEQETAKKEILQLTEELRDSRVRNSISQMQPHFLYNALASIREVILENPEYGSDLICDFTTHLRACIRSMSNNDLVPFSQELENVKAYVNIEKMRFGDRLGVSYEIGCEDFLIAPLSIQPLVENAIRHGICGPLSEGGKVRLTTAKENGFYTVTVRDDGVGFDHEKVRREVELGQRDSTGLSNLTFRLEKIMDAKVEISSRPGDGTTVTVRIPVENGQRRQKANENHRG